MIPAWRTGISVGQNRGSRVALDQLGTGFAGFSSVRRLPLDGLKMAAHLSTDLTTRAGGDVVRAVVNLAVTTVASGVSDQTALRRRELGVDAAQGDVLGAPEPLTQDRNRA